MRWVPAYVPKWIIGDVIAGLSVGMLFIPQALAYSAVAGVSVQHAVLSCWLPGIIYAVMGTSKGGDSYGSFFYLFLKSNYG